MKKGSGQKLEDFFINKNNKRNLLNLFKKTIENGLDFKFSKGRKEVINYRDQKEIMESFFTQIPKEGKDLDDLLDEFEDKVVNGSINFSSPKFLGFPDCGNSSAATIGHIYSGFLNQNLINSAHTSPTATFVEIEVINWLRSIAGFNIKKDQKNIMDVGGISVTGGTSANTIGLMLARENKFRNTMSKGISPQISQKMKVFIPLGVGHYSIGAAMGWLGMGKENVVEVKITENFKIDQEDLTKKIKEEEEKGNIPFCLVAYGGDSRTMAIDDFQSLAKIAKKNKIWFHIDACHGYSLCFSGKMKKKIRGINLADSVTIDPHKVLFTPYTLSFILLKDPKKFKLIAGVSDLITKENFSFGQITPLFGSRSFDSAKLWFLIKNLGKDNIGKLIERRHEMVQYFGELIKKTDNFYLMNNIEINSAVFIYVPKELKNKLPSKISIQKINQLNKNIQQRMFKEGEFYLHTFQLNDFKNVLKTGVRTIFQLQRLMLGNPLTSKKDLNGLIAYLKKTSIEEWEKLKDG